MTARKPFAVTFSTLAAGALILSACSSSGGGGSAPSESKIAAKLKSDPEVTSQLGAAPAATKTKFYNCAAKVMADDGSGSDIKKYVDGEIKIDSIHGKSGKSESDVEKALKACVTS